MPPARPLVAVGRPRRPYEGRAKQQAEDYSYGARSEWAWASRRWLNRSRLRSGGRFGRGPNRRPTRQGSAGHQAVRVILVDRVILRVPVQVDAALIPDGVAGEEPSRRRVVEAVAQQRQAARVAVRVPAPLRPEPGVVVPRRTLRRRRPRPLPEPVRDVLVQARRLHPTRRVPRRVEPVGQRVGRGASVRWLTSPLTPTVITAPTVPVVPICASTVSPSETK